MVAGMMQRRLQRSRSFPNYVVEIGDESFAYLLEDHPPSSFDDSCFPLEDATTKYHKSKQTNADDDPPPMATTTSDEDDNHEDDAQSSRKRFFLSKIRSKIKARKDMQKQKKKLPPAWKPPPAPTRTGTTKKAMDMRTMAKGCFYNSVQDSNLDPSVNCTATTILLSEDEFSLSRNHHGKFGLTNDDEDEDAYNHEGNYYFDDEDDYEGSVAGEEPLKYSPPHGMNEEQHLLQLESMLSTSFDCYDDASRDGPPSSVASSSIHGNNTIISDGDHQEARREPAGMHGDDMLLDPANSLSWSSPGGGDSNNAKGGAGGGRRQSLLQHWKESMRKSLNKVVGRETEWQGELLKQRKLRRSQSEGTGTAGRSAKKTAHYELKDEGSSSYSKDDSDAEFLVEPNTSFVYPEHPVSRLPISKNRTRSAFRDLRVPSLDSQDSQDTDNDKGRRGNNRGRPPTGRYSTPKPPPSSSDESSTDAQYEVDFPLVVTRAASYGGEGIECLDGAVATDEHQQTKNMYVSFDKACAQLVLTSQEIAPPEQQRRSKLRYEMEKEEEDEDEEFYPSNSQSDIDSDEEDEEVGQQELDIEDDASSVMSDISESLPLGVTFGHPSAVQRTKREGNYDQCLMTNKLDEGVEVSLLSSVPADMVAEEEEAVKEQPQEDEEKDDIYEPLGIMRCTSDWSDMANQYSEYFGGAKKSSTKSSTATARCTKRRTAQDKLTPAVIKSWNDVADRCYGATTVGSTTRKPSPSRRNSKSRSKGVTATKSKTKQQYDYSWDDEADKSLPPLQDEESGFKFSPSECKKKKQPWDLCLAWPTGDTHTCFADDDHSDITMSDVFHGAVNLQKKKWQERYRDCKKGSGASRRKVVSRTPTVIQESTPYDETPDATRESTSPPSQSSLPYDEAAAEGLARTRCVADAVRRSRVVAQPVIPPFHRTSPTATTRKIDKEPTGKLEHNEDDYGRRKSSSTFLKPRSNSIWMSSTSNNNSSAGSKPTLARLMPNSSLLTDYLMDALTHKPAAVYIEDGDALADDEVASITSRSRTSSSIQRELYELELERQQLTLAIGSGGRPPLYSAPRKNRKREVAVCHCVKCSARNVYQDLLQLPEMSTGSI